MILAVRDSRLAVGQRTAAQILVEIADVRQD
jgi:hypothetical protein